MIYELNETNGLFKFVRIMREKFQEAATQGTILSFASYLANCMPENDIHSTVRVVVLSSETHSWSKSQKQIILLDLLTWMWHFTLHFSFLLSKQLTEKLLCTLTYSFCVQLWNFIEALRCIFIHRIINHFFIYEPGFLPQLTNHQESSMISTSAPAQSMSTDRSESPTKKNDHQVLHEEGTTPSTKLHYARGIKPLSWRWSYAIKKKFLL